MSREITAVYRDPLEVIWLTAARRVGVEIARSAEVYASADGRGTVTIGDRATLDADDSLAQMILHELCHSLIEGAASFHRSDWGLDNGTDRDDYREQACLRLQASLAREYSLGEVLAPTTDFRSFYDRLGANPFAGADTDVDLARAGYARIDQPPWSPHLREALQATRAIANAVRPFAEDSAELWARFTERERERP